MGKRFHIRYQVKSFFSSTIMCPPVFRDGKSQVESQHDWTSHQTRMCIEDVLFVSVLMLDVFVVVVGGERSILYGVNIKKEGFHWSVLKLDQCFAVNNNIIWGIYIYQINQFVCVCVCNCMWFFWFHLSYFADEDVTSLLLLLIAILSSLFHFIRHLSCNHLLDTLPGD